MSEAVPPPDHDRELDGEIPEADHPRDTRDLITGLMVVWDCSRPEARKRMEPYTDGQCEHLIREYWL